MWILKYIKKNASSKIIYEDKRHAQAVDTHMLIGQIHLLIDDPFLDIV